MTSPPGAPLRLGHLVPERRPVVIARANPLWLSLADDDPRRAETPDTVDVILQGYVFGPRCPGVVKAELASIEETYLAILNTTGRAAQEEEEAGPYATGTSGFVGAWHTFLRETITVMVPGITTGEADVLAAVAPGAEGPGTDLLRYLGVWGQRTEGAGPEVDGAVVPSITAPSLPISPPSTD